MLQRKKRESSTRSPHLGEERRSRNTKENVTIIPSSAITLPREVSWDNIILMKLLIIYFSEEAF
jgi:hypothetical protein